MTDEEKKLLQAKHRLEEAQARDRVKERKARTRRLIQEGAVLEKVLPEVQAVGLDNLEEYLRRLPSETHLRVQSEGDCGSCGSRWTRLHFCQTASLLHAVGAGVSVLEAPVRGVVYCHPIPPPACVNLPPAA